MWTILGWICVVIGAVGAFLPVLPTVPFLLLAAFCFERGSPRLHQWLTHHPTFGPPINEWRKHRVIRPRAKAWAALCLVLSVVYLIFYGQAPDWLKGLVTGFCLLVLIFILSRPSAPPEDSNGL